VPSKSVTFRYRQPSRRVCAISDDPDAEFSRAEPWSECGDSGGVDLAEADETELEKQLLRAASDNSDKTVEPSDIFSLLDADGDNEINLDEFMRLFDVLDFPLTQNQKDR